VLSGAGVVGILEKGVRKGKEVLFSGREDMKGASSSVERRTVLLGSWVERSAQCHQVFPTPV
jgi:hypothetical protein